MYTSVQKQRGSEHLPALLVPYPQVPGGARVLLGSTDQRRLATRRLSVDGRTLLQRIIFGGSHDGLVSEACVEKWG